MENFSTDENIQSDEDIRRIVEQYADMLFRVAYSALRSREDAEDAVQEAFVRLLDIRPRFASPGHEKAWLIRVTVNICRSRLRLASRRDIPLELYPEQPDGNMSANTYDGSGVLEAVLSLPEKYSSVLHLYYFEDQPIREIARTLRIPAATVGTRLARGRELLRKRLTEGGGKYD